MRQKLAAEPETHHVSKSAILERALTQYLVPEPGQRFAGAEPLRHEAIGA